MPDNWAVGDEDGTDDGELLATADGDVVGPGFDDGDVEGTTDGCWLGATVGVVLVVADGNAEGGELGLAVG